MTVLSSMVTGMELGINITAVNGAFSPASLARASSGPLRYSLRSISINFLRNMVFLSATILSAVRKLVKQAYST